MKKNFTLKMYSAILVILISGMFNASMANMPGYVNVKPVNISFAGANYEGWNVVKGFNVNEGIATLKDEEGNTTSISLTITERFGGTNAAGTDNATTPINLPKEITKDNFFGNTGTFGGGQFPKATFVISHLYPDVEYDFAIFASRMSATDNRETYYKFSGLEAGDTILYLNPSNNTSQLVEAFKIKPGNTGEITVEVGPGPNNNNSLGFFHLTAMRMVPNIEVTTVPFVKQLNVSFVSGPLDSTWNVLGDFRENAKATKLRDIDANFTDVSLVVTERFNHINTGGAEVTDTEMDMPAEVSKASFYGNTATFLNLIVPKSTIKFTSLDPQSSYDFSIFASRMGSTDNREAYYQFSGATVADTTLYLDASDNSSNIVSAVGIVPDNNGEIFIEIGPGPNNTNTTGFYYISAMNIRPQSVVSGVSDVSDDQLRLYPNPATDVLNVFIKNKEDKVRILSIDGREVINLGTLNSGVYNSLPVDVLKPGVYIMTSGISKKIFIKK